MWEESAAGFSELQLQRVTRSISVILSAIVLFIRSSANPSIIRHPARPNLVRFYSHGTGDERVRGQGWSGEEVKFML